MTKKRNYALLPLIPLLSIPLLLTACLGMPEGVKPVKNFELDRYLGTWYEIARLDHRFERGLSNVTAHYSLREDGSVQVINRGYSSKKGEWEEAEGKARFVGAEDQGYLKVSFFGPFYGSYIIFELDQDNYQHAFISGPDRSYLWILAREPQVPETLLDELLAKAEAAGYDTSELIFVEHDQSP